MPDRKRIGLLWPADGRNDREFWNWLPESVSVLIARYEVDGGLDVSQIESDGDADRIAAAARMLRHADPDILALGDCAAGFIGGADFENALIRSASTSGNGKLVLSMSASIASALKRVEARKVAILSPYNARVTKRFEIYLSNMGFAVAESRCCSAESESDIQRFSDKKWINEAEAADEEGADALAVPGGGVSLSGIIARLEMRLAKPVICGPGALMWAALSSLSVDFSSDDLGALFRVGFGNAPKK